MDRRYSPALVLAVAALLAQACSSSSTSGTGGAGGGSSSGGATGAGGKAATGGATGSGGAGAGGVTGAGGKVDGGGTGGVTGSGGATDGGGTDTSGAGGATVDSGSDTPVITDGGADADPAAPEKALCATTPYMSLSAPPFTATQFCTLYMEICNNVVGARAFANEAACETAYTGYNTDPDAGAGTEGPNGQKGCRTDHLCLANVSAGNAMIHCPHTTGLANGDAGPGGPCP